MAQPERGLEPTNLPIRACIADDLSGLNLLMTEPERGLEPTDLRFTKPLLCQLSYSGTFYNLSIIEVDDIESQACMPAVLFRTPALALDKVDWFCYFRLVDI